MSFAVRGGTAMLSLVLFATPAMAQRITAGAKIGLAMASVSDVDDLTDTRDDDAGRALRPMLGGFVAIDVGPLVALQPEVLFTSKGASLDDGDADLRLGYIEVPLLLKLSSPPEGDRALYMLVGPSLGFRVRASIRTDDDEDQDLEESVKNTDVGIAVGGGVRMGRWLFEIRLTQGLTNIAADDDDDVIKTRAFAAVIGVRF